MLKNSDNNKITTAIWIVVNGSDIWTINGELPTGTASELELPAENAVCVGSYNNLAVMWINESDVERQLELTSLRELLLLPQALFLLASKAVQYGHMTQTLRFCPHCGGRNFLNHIEIAMQCGECRSIHYPRIYPCTIIAVRKENQILLAQHARHKSSMYTVIAGFMEVGETLEQCAAREVKEETGIEVKNIRYFASQPWAFPSSMMVGFIADYSAGDIKVDYSELSDARWFSIDELPELAPVGTIARALIEQTITDITENDE
ncbi:NADH pyrophosphatase [Vibrio sp. MACH09]|uniref:NAD(+) diphosphatase n=1 Tax=Vibrio sp. MACH09 TaxID=3025122 RepID=UPI002791EA13|nr:NAD(+) diphosphatase [Vibrio sp. MACH09]GLO62230.1 NADH pyrophosphatase [Vibrio sp. MACH09]